MLSLCAVGHARTGRERVYPRSSDEYHAGGVLVSVFSFVNLFCTLLETVSIILAVFIRFVLMSLLHTRICGVLVGCCYED